MTAAQHEPNTDADAPELAPSLEPGRIIAGRYRIERMLGAGGMGAVHEATHLTLDRRVAFKVLHPALTVDAGLVARFRREAKTMAGLTHPNVVQVFDAGQEGPLVFIVMEFLSGSTLADWIDARVPCDPAALLPLVIPVGRALSFVHARGIVHRDVKPDNVFLVKGDDGSLTPKVLDFGIARPISQEGAKSITATGAILGTPAYMAPEQTWGLKEITHAADQWAFAAMLYEAFCGEIPHQCETAHALLVRRVSEPVADLGARCPSLDPALVAALMRALATEPANRFPSMEAFIDALNGAPTPGVAPVVATPVDIAATAEAPPLVTPPPPVERTPIEAPPTRVPPTRWPLAFVIAVVAVGLIAGGFALTRRDRVAPTVAPPPTVATPMVTLGFDFSPVEARILLDGAELGAGHASTQVARGGVHSLRVEADGYLPFVDSVRADGDLRISRSLVRRVQDAAPTATPAATGVARPVRPTATAPATPRVPHGRRRIDEQWPP